MKAILAALAICLLVVSSGCNCLSCNSGAGGFPSFGGRGGGGCGGGEVVSSSGFGGGSSISAGCPKCGGALGRLGCGDCGLGFGGGGGRHGGGSRGCGGRGMCTGRCGGPGNCGGQLAAQLEAQLDQFKAITARNCANGGCGLPPGPQSGAVNYPYYTTRGPRDFLMCNPPSIGP